MKTSVLMTVFNREIEVLCSTLRGLRRAWADEMELVVVDDGSTQDYSGVREHAEARLPGTVWKKAEPYPAYRDGGYNNPARAFNEALLASSGEKLIVMSSDVLVTPKAMAAALEYDLSCGMWSPLVIDLDSGKQYCGPNRIFPAPWMLVCRRSDVMEIGGWDEAYLEGHCYEDNDFIGRLALKSGMFTVDWGVTVYHQSHEQPAYNMENPEIEAANERNRRYTMAKWAGGIPFNGSYAAFDVSRFPHPSGRTVLKCVDTVGDRLMRAVAGTKGIVASVPV